MKQIFLQLLRRFVFLCLSDCIFYKFELGVGIGLNLIIILTSHNNPNSIVEEKLSSLHLSAVLRI